MKVLHRHDWQVIGWTQVSFSDGRNDTKFTLLCRPCGKVKNKNFRATRMNSDSAEQVANARGWKHQGFRE